MSIIVAIFIWKRIFLLKKDLDIVFLQELRNLIFGRVQYEYKID